MSNVKTKATDKEVSSSNAYPLGVEGRPFPMTFTDERGNRELGVLEGKNGHLQVFSERSYAEMVGVAYRDMPTPGMLHLFKRGTEKRQPGHTNRVEAILGDPGAGKSFLGNLHARMRSQRGAILVDCGGRDLSELLYETVLDKSAGDSLFAAYDKALAKGGLSDVSIAQLKAALGSAFTQEGNRAAIDWNEVAKSRIDHEALDAAREQIAAEVGKEHHLSADQVKEQVVNEEENAVTREVVKRTNAISDQLLAEADARRDNALKVLEEVAGREGLASQSGGASIGLTVKEGPLIRAWKENRPIILDEYNKSKPGTDDALQVLWQVFNGEMKEHTVKGGNGESFTFRRDETPDQFFVTVTGNKTKDGFSTRSLSKSAIDRLKPEFIEPTTVADWQHRICQKLTGLPVSTIHAANADYWNSHKQEFKEWLTEMRKIGLTEEQQANIPSWQFAMIQNSDKVLAASEQLATFYDRWAQVLDVDSKLHRSKDGSNNQAVPSSVAAEVDDPEYQREVTVGMRRMMENIDEAVLVSPEANPSYDSKGVKAKDDWTQPPEVLAREPEEVEKQFGTRLEQVIFDNIIATTPEKPELRKWLIRQAQELNILEPEAEEAVKLAHHRLSARLNIDPEQNKIPEGLEETHALLADYVRRTFKSEDGLELSADDLDIISPAALAAVLSGLENQTTIDRPSTRSGVIYLPNSDDEKSMDEPVVGVIGKNGATFDSAPEYVDNPHATPETRNLRKKLAKEEDGFDNLLTDYPTQDLADAERFLISLAVPTLKGKNLDGLWSQYSRSTEVDSPEIPALDAVKIAENQSSSGVATQLLLCKTTDESGQEKDEFIFVVHDRFANQGKGETLVTGTAKISDRLAAALEAQHVTYVDRESAGAETKIASTLDKLLKGKAQDANAVEKYPFSQLVLQSLTLIMPAQIVGTITNPNGVDVKQLEGLRYTLPHPEVDETNNNNSGRMSPEWGQKVKENLVALLSDRDGYLAKNQGFNEAFAVTTSKDLDTLKHTLKALQQPEQKQAAGQAL